MTERSIVAIVGSTRAESWNNRLAHAALSLAPTTMRWEVVRSDLPLYDADADASDVPDSVTSLRTAVAAADGIVVVTPEYNYGLPGPLKNTLDWLSRPAFRSPLRDKPVTSLGSTPGPGNAGRAVVSLNQYFIAVAAAPLPWPATAIGRIGELLDEEGNLDDPTAARIAAQLSAFDAWIDAVDGYRATR